MPSHVCEVWTRWDWNMPRAPKSNVCHLQTRHHLQTEEYSSFKSLCRGESQNTERWISNFPGWRGEDRCQKGKKADSNCDFEWRKVLSRTQTPNPIFSSPPSLHPFVFWRAIDISDLCSSHFGKGQRRWRRGRSRRNWLAPVDREIVRSQHAWTQFMFPKNLSKAKGIITQIFQSLHKVTRQQSWTLYLS